MSGEFEVLCYLLWVWLISFGSWFNTSMVLECGRDEEYDRGKKKKIRIKEDMYKGPNPFQMIASRKQTDTKKKWTQRMNTAKTGLRI